MRFGAPVRARTVQSPTLDEQSKPSIRADELTCRSSAIPTTAPRMSMPRKPGEDAQDDGSDDQGSLSVRRGRWTSREGARRRAL